MHGLRYDRYGECIINKKKLMVGLALIVLWLGVGEANVHAQVGYEHCVYLPLVMKPAPPITDRLVNAGFEGWYTHDTLYGERPVVLTPDGWVTWWRESDAEDMVQPEVVRPISTNDPVYVELVPRIHGGSQAMQLYNWGTYEAGFYQKVDALPPGARAIFSAYGHAWSCNEDLPEGPYSCGDPYGFLLKVGIDPTGGEDPWADSVIWSADAYIYDAYEKVGPISTLVGEDGAVTVFIYSYAKWPVKHNEAYWDDAELIVQP